MKINRPSFFQVIRGDAISSFFALGPIIEIATILYFYFSEGEIATTFLWYFVGTLILATVVIFIRYRSITLIFEEGIEVSGVITEVYIPTGDSQSSAHINFSYEFHGDKYQSRNSTSEKKADSLAVGQSIKVILDHNNPKRAFVKELFLDEQ